MTFSVLPRSEMTVMCLDTWGWVHFQQCKSSELVISPVIQDASASSKSGSDESRSGVSLMHTRLPYTVTIRSLCSISTKRMHFPFLGKWCAKHQVQLSALWRLEHVSGRVVSCSWITGPVFCSWSFPVRLRRTQKEEGQPPEPGSTGLPGVLFLPL